MLSWNHSLAETVHLIPFCYENYTVINKLIHVVVLVPTDAHGQTHCGTKY